MPGIAAAPVTVNIRWEYKNFPSKIGIYEISGYPVTWEMKSVPALSQSPASKLIEGSTFTMSPGDVKRFALVTENKSAAPLFFFAAPHTAHPAENALGFTFTCLCTGNAYRVGAGESWYRVVELRLAKEYVGSNLTLTHTIVGVDQKRAAAFVPTTP